MLEDTQFPLFCRTLENYQQYISQELQRQDLPAADPNAVKTSFFLSQKIAQKIIENGNIDFQEFMQMALYEPTLGYYASGNQKFGAGGDFVTAPEISPLFAETFAQEFIKVFAETEANILEFGAGSGVFAADCLLALEAANQLPKNYYILEVSAELQARQKQTTHEKAPHLIDKITWLNALPENYRGVIFANEVADAIPVGLYQKQQMDFKQAKVKVNDDGFVFDWQTNTKIDKKVQNGNYFELRPQLDGWINSIIKSCQKAAVFIVDYGYSEDELLHPSRINGTLQHYYRHHKTDSPLSLLGMQDLTSSVDFTQIAMAADKNHAQLLGYTSQSMFLLGAGIEQLAQQKMESLATSDTMASMKIGQQLKQLMMPDEMGETCKVLAFATGYESNSWPELQGFSLSNQLHNL